jgi:hypothetical protein
MSIHPFVCFFMCCLLAHLPNGWGGLVNCPAPIWSDPKGARIDAWLRLAEKTPRFEGCMLGSAFLFTSILRKSLAGVDNSGQKL